MTTITRSLVLLAVLATATGVGFASTREAKSDAPDDQLASDLELAASASSLPSASPGFGNGLETVPQSAPEAAPVVREAAGPKVTTPRRRPPTVRSAPAEVHAEGEVAASPMTMTPIANRPSGDDGASGGVALPRPVPAPYPGEGAGGGGDWGSAGDGQGRGGSGGGMGGIGSVIGVIIRGGGVDGDDCELHDRGRMGGRAGGGRVYPPVYMPNPGGMATGSRGGGSVVTGTRGAMRPARPTTSDGSGSPGAASRGPRGIPSRRTLGN